jgi:NADPH:quinone reductase-like Zn-dependent oxidoreductase
VLHDVATLKPGQRVLIHGGAGKIGSFAVQLAKLQGAEVIATASGDAIPFVRELGADTVIDYRTQAFEQVVSHVDVVLDVIGGETQARSWGVLKPGGVLVSVVQPPNPEAAKQARARGEMTAVQVNGKRLGEIAGLFDKGKLQTSVGKVFSLQDAKHVHELLDQHKAPHGKLIFEVS